MITKESIPTIGQMRMVIKFEQVSKASDNTSGQNEGYSEWFTCRGFLKIKSGYQKFETGFDSHVNDYNLWVRWRSVLEAGLTEKDNRVIYEARQFKIIDYNLVGEKRDIYHMTLKEVV